MPLSRVTGFGNAGLKADPQPSMIEPGAWSTLENIDIENGDIRSAWGEAELPGGVSPVDPKYTFSYTSKGVTSILVSDGLAVWSYDDSGTSGVFVWRDIAAAAQAAGRTGGVVSFTIFLGIVVINFSEGRPAQWDAPEMTEVTFLPGWEDAWHCIQIIAYKNFLFAVGMYSEPIALPYFPENGDYVLAWSDAAVTGELPSSWRSTPENLAGSLQLADTNGVLVRAEILKDDLIVYKDDSIYRGFYTGDEFIFSFERAINDRGCDSYRGVAALSGVHFFCDRDDIRVFDGQGTQSIVNDRVRSLMAQSLSVSLVESTVQIVAWPGRDEVYISIPTENDDTTDLILVYHVDIDAWTFRDLPTEVQSMCLLEATGAADITGLREDTMIYGQPSQGFDDGRIYIADRSNTTFTNAPKLCVAERTGMILTDLEQSVTMRAVYPEIRGDAAVSISIGCQWAANGDVRWTTPQVFRPGIDKRVNTRITGIPTAFRITSEVDGDWSLGALSYLYSPAGRR